ncbi:hypothetical protein F5Y16DRAFT_404218 [Xylariaceae sp. FL0255]|nr:hypothetical protein F5Y16DRAFT_404218 [Xylariaceae sp. FL0255]
MPSSAPIIVPCGRSLALHQIGFRRSCWLKRQVPGSSTKSVPPVKTLRGFHIAMGHIGKIPEAFRDQPLIDLGTRIPRLSKDERRMARTVWLKGLEQLSVRSDVLEMLVQVIDQDAYYSIALLSKLATVGMNVNTIAQLFEITHPEYLRSLQEMFLDGPAGAAIREGSHVSIVAQQYGITDPEYLRRLQEMSLDGPAGAAIREAPTSA